MRLAACYVRCYNAANNASFLKLSQNEITTDIEEITHHKLDVYIHHEMKYTHAPAQWQKHQWRGRTSVEIYIDFDVQTEEEFHR